MSERKHRLVDCNPHFVEDGKGAICALYFECPEGHDDCKHVVPFAPALDGSAGNWNNGGSGPIWQRSGGVRDEHTWGPVPETGPLEEGGVCTSCGLFASESASACVAFDTLTLSPSIRRIQRYPDKAAALAAGCLEEYITDSLFCALHIFIANGQIQFCGDSK